MTFTAQDLLWLLLPLAAASGWFVARLEHKRQNRPQDIELPSAYFKGLNYLLNEQPDKAIELFIRVLEVNTETVETHLALGNLFRRRGEVERAIRIHQNLIARPTLDKEQRSQALMELGQDYMKAGLFDRAENLFLELAEDRAHAAHALRQLLHIYQQEKEWGQAIQACRKLMRISGADMSPVIAQYQCELAEDAFSASDYASARAHIKQALSSDPRCVRATILQGNIEAASGQHRDAIRAWRRIENQNASMLGEVAERIANSYLALNDSEGMYSFFSDAAERHNSVAIMSVLADIIKQREGVQAAEAFVIDWLRRHPNVAGLSLLVNLNMEKHDGRRGSDLALLKGIIEQLQGRHEGYVCQQCGFKGRSMHWLCPGCNQWNTIKPNVETE